MTYPTLALSCVVSLCTHSRRHSNFLFFTVSGRKNTGLSPSAPMASIAATSECSCSALSSHLVVASDCSRCRSVFNHIRTLRRSRQESRPSAAAAIAAAPSRGDSALHKTEVAEATRFVTGAPLRGVTTSSNAVRHRHGMLRHLWPPAGRPTGCEHPLLYADEGKPAPRTKPPYARSSVVSAAVASSPPPPGNPSSPTRSRCSSVGSTTMMSVTAANRHILNLKEQLKAERSRADELRDEVRKLAAMQSKLETLLIGRSPESVH
jgi:hypothetical protein